MNRTTLNLFGFVYGLFIINGVAFSVYYFLKTDNIYGVLLSAGLGSFLGFVLMQYSPIPLLKKLIVPGLVLSFMGGFLIGFFKNTCEDFSALAQLAKTTKSIRVDQVSKYEQEDLLKFKDLFVYY